jgi:hypothetical protein
MVSPGINISERDATTVVAAVSTTRAGMAGVFKWGPVDQRVTVSNQAELVQNFGKPTDFNPETFFTGANFLDYGNSLDVVRVIETGNANTSLNSASAYSNTGSVSAAPVVRNSVDFANTTLDANVVYVAKYPGVLGNSLKISICDSANQYSNAISANDAGVTASSLTFTPGSNSAAFLVQANTTVANAVANTFLARLTVGDYIEAGNSSIGKQKMKVTAISVATTTGSNAAATISFSQPYSLVTAYASNTVVRSWEYADFIDRAPTTSQFLRDRSLSAIDELHAVVVDEDGLFTGFPGTLLEVWPALSRATDATGENQQSNYYKTVINNQSDYIWVGADRTGAISNTAVNVITSTATAPYTASLGNGADGATESTIPLGKLALGYDMFKNADDVDISIILQGKARGSSADSSTTISSGAVNYSTLANYIASNICEVRKDCILVVSPSFADAVNASDKTAAITQYYTNINYASSYWFGDSGYKYQYDKYNDKYRWVPLNGDIAGTMVRTDFDRDPWYSPAGTQRGRIKNVIKLGFDPNQAERDTLYKAGINPVIIKKGQGALLYGDKTGIGRASAFDRINVRRLFIVLEKAISNAAEFALFEFNDLFTRNRFISIVEPFLRDVQGRRGITDFRVVCDETNNTAQVIQTNQFVGDIFIKPNYSINYIRLSFVAVGSSVEFNEIVGQI